ncbi:hypothetical protein OIU85_020840 [Salix viminalis]|uniref:Uncharacterized protein n=1 Tax=Salix viminalis TaxID=40686 RepID=A0A9Q0ZD48_SALVM|nr:hypothetical protein OIU85_020840 [Salix viminalis]
MIGPAAGVDLEAAKSRFGGRSWAAVSNTCHAVRRPRIALPGTHSSRGDQGHAQQCCQQIRQVDEAVSVRRFTVNDRGAGSSSNAAALNRKETTEVMRATRNTKTDAACPVSVG